MKKGYKDKKEEAKEQAASLAKKGKKTLKKGYQFGKKPIDNPAEEKKETK